jgi:tetratricopeptide (TPR) repeat protein
MRQIARLVRADTVARQFVGGVVALLLCGVVLAHAETVTGTGFAVTFDGILVTNHHVISECDSPIRARIEGSTDSYYVASVVAHDASRDLAALKLQRHVGESAKGPISTRAIFRSGPPVQQGERAITYGFPLRGLLPTNGNLTSGNVSALRGLADDRNYIQITTPVQQGNSGGPLYDGSGHVIGVVVAKLDALRVMLATGDVPQNVNFAVEIGAVRHFLKQNKVQITEEESANELPLPEIAQKARLSAYLIECETQDAVGPAPSALTPPPISPRETNPPKPLITESQRPIPLDLTKLKFSDIRRPYPTLSPQIFEIAISNAGLDRVTELTIGFRRAQGQPCSGNFEEYDGFKRFNINLLPGDSVTLTGEFSAQAASFCIVRAVGPPLGLAGCFNSAVAADVAISACTGAIKSGQIHGKELAAAYYHRGDRYEDQKDHDQAIADYDNAIRHNPQSDYAFFRRGYSEVKKSDYERALSDLSKAIELNPNSLRPSYLSAAFHLRGQLYLRRGDYERTVTDFMEAIRLDPSLRERLRLNLADAIGKRGRNYARKGEYDRAIADYSEAMRLNPDLASAYLNRRGYAHHAKGNYDRAISDYDAAIRISPSYATAYHNRGFAYFGKGEHDRAIADYTEAIGLDQSLAISYRNRGLAHLYSGSREKAQADLEVATQLMPQDVYLALWREIAARQANAASILAQAALQIDMTTWPAPVVMFFLGESTQAALLASAKDSDPKRSRERLCEVNFFAGQLALQRRSKEEAKHSFQIAVRDCPRISLEMGAATAELKALK